VNGANHVLCLVPLAVGPRVLPRGWLPRIHVERFNPALRLYERLGFRQVEDKGVYLFLEWDHNSQLPTPNSQGESFERSG
jgi:hypothetical protein